MPPLIDCKAIDCRAARCTLEIADIFRAHGPAYRRANAGHLSLGQLKVMSAIEACRTEALGGHVAACAKCGHQHIAYNSCKNRHCPKCQGPAARDWMVARAQDLLPVEYFHVVFTLPAEIAYWNKRAVYGLLFKASAETVAADPRRLGVRIGMTSVLHTWGSALTHHPHIHMIVPGGGLSTGGTKWNACRPGYFLPVRVLSRLFRRLFIEGLLALHRTGQLAFFGDLSGLANVEAFAEYLAPVRKTERVVYAKPPFGGPEAVLAYLSRYTHRVAISNHSLVSAAADTVAFRWKDYRIKSGDRMKLMRLDTHEFIRRFLIHVLPDGFHRIRHYGLLASAARKANIAKIRTLLGEETAAQDNAPAAEIIPLTLREPCPDCGGVMRIIDDLLRMHVAGHGRHEKTSLPAMLGAACFTFNGEPTSISRLPHRVRYVLFRQLADGMTHLQKRSVHPAIDLWTRIALAAPKHSDLVASLSAEITSQITQGTKTRSRHPDLADLQQVIVRLHSNRRTSLATAMPAN